MGTTERGQSISGAGVLRPLVRGAVIGLGAATVQVLVSQVVGLADGASRAEPISPPLGAAERRERLGMSPSRPLRWFLAAAFHFSYGIGWGALYTLACELPQVRRTPPWLSGGLLGGILYTAAFSRIGGGTLVGSERPPARRRWYELAIQRGFASALVRPRRWPTPSGGLGRRLSVRRVMRQMTKRAYDAVIVGAGQNGLAAAVTLAEAGRRCWCWKRRR